MRGTALCGEDAHRHRFVESMCPCCSGLHRVIPGSDELGVTKVNHAYAWGFCKPGSGTLDTYVCMYVCMYDYAAVSTRTLTPPATGTTFEPSRAHAGANRGQNPALLPHVPTLPKAMDGQPNQPLRPWEPNACDQSDRNISP